MVTIRTRRKNFKKTYQSGNWRLHSKSLRSTVGMTVLLILFVVSGGCVKPVQPELGTEKAWHESSTSIWHHSYEDALSDSISTGKPILADFTGSDWCVWCKRLKSEIFDKDQFIEWAGDNVVLLELDYPRNDVQSSEIKRQNEELAQRYQIDSYPTVLLISQDGRVIGRMGYIKGGPEALIKIAESRISSVKPAP